MILHPWHLISAGKDAPKVVTSIIEIPKGSRAKYELDKVTGLLRLDRVLQTELTYPANYGFIPQTYCEDSDPLDIILICSEPVLPLSIVEARVIGALKILDGGEQDDKLIGVAHYDQKLAHVTDLASFPKEELDQIVHFFSEYKKPEKNTVEIQKIIDADEAQHVVDESISRYKETFGNDDHI
jgi:inorganic pyrophosphatase